jgi:hypothetical protein
LRKEAEARRAAAGHGKEIDWVGLGNL